MLEEELKNRIWQRYFKKYDCAEIIKRIDFTVKSTSKINPEYLFWAEAKQSQTDIYKMLTQLIVTIKQDAYNILPPKFIGCFDNEKIVFVEYNEVLPIYALNDFNWTQTPSQVDYKSVAALQKVIKPGKVFTFYYGKDDDEIHNFVEQNFIEGGSLLSTMIDKNNFIFVYQKWREMVMPSINADWKKLSKDLGVYDRDFFLAELNIDDNNTTDINDDKNAYPDFYITFSAAAQKSYSLIRKDNFGYDVTYSFGFKKGGLEKYAEFWKRYKRPPKNVYWNYIISLLDLLVPQDVRERKGAFFTPQIWVEKSQKYLADTFGKDWQENYYIWDCCAGTGNLLNGLVNKYNVYASTLDQQDVDVMKERIKNGANLLESHVFQFDFLNDDFSKCPESLRKILYDAEKRKKLIIYINPPYKEAASAKTIAGTGQNQAEVSSSTQTYQKFGNEFGRTPLRELFVQFFARIYKEVPDCILAQFSKLKILQSPNFEDFRRVFNAKLEKLFLMPAYTFDNVAGKFPIGFFIWDLSKKQPFTKIKADVYDEKGDFILKKNIGKQDSKVINSWLKAYTDVQGAEIGGMCCIGNDFQHNNYVNIDFTNCIKGVGNAKGVARFKITVNNIIPACVYFSVRQCFKANWYNDRDQFLSPKLKWEKDVKFISDCLVFSIFHSQNRISSVNGTNHWIPFSESEVDSKEKFDSHFMCDFLTGKKMPKNQQNNLFANNEKQEFEFSNEAQIVLNSGLQLWKYYHTMEAANVNASLYDIKEFF
ncbi:MAG: hypothetical protein IJ150_03320, partial [Bacteroidales bacterium]|nr:hypothetical protein [Bacteroidales bacterium]